MYEEEGKAAESQGLRAEGQPVRRAALSPSRLFIYHALA